MPEERRVALLSALHDLRLLVARLAALAGATVEPASTSSAARVAWRTADAVVVGADLAAAVAAAHLPRRDRVVVVTSDQPDAALWRAAVALGALRVIVVPDDERALLDVLADAVDAPPVGGTAVAVVGGCGGAGASTLAAALALTYARSDPCLLIDADRLGGGIDILLGIERVPGARWPDLAETRGRLSTDALTGVLPSVSGGSVLSWGRGPGEPVDPGAAEAVLGAGLRGFRHTVVDLPRSADPAATVLAAAADVVILVVPATVRSVAAATAIARDLATDGRRLQLVVRDPGSGRLAAGDVAGALRLGDVVTWHSDAAVTRAAERGEPPPLGRGSLASVCRDLLRSAERLQVAA